MDNKKYLDKVLDHMVRGTKIDYENGRVSPPSCPYQFPLPYHPLSLPSYFCFVSDYCGNQFGLTDEEIDYVWEEYREIIEDKIEDGQ